MAVDENREAFEAWFNSPDRLPLETPNGGDAPTGFEAGWQARGEHDAATKPEVPNIQAAAALIKKTAYILTDSAAGRGSSPYLRNPDEIARAVAELWGMGSEPEAPHSNGIPSEIPDNANDALTKHVGRNGFPGERFADYKSGFFDGYEIASTKPVSVVVCDSALADEYLAVHENPGDISNGELWKKMAKAVLSKAGVSYVD